MTGHATPAFPDVPRPDHLIEVAEGVLWTRFELPFSLNHVNIYVLDDGDGWAILDTGLGDARTQAAWETLLAGGLAGRRVNRIIVTHHHPDHIGMAGWLTRKLDVPLVTSQAEFLLALHYNKHQGAVDGDAYHQLYNRHGFTETDTLEIMQVGHRYQRLITGLPANYLRVDPGTTLKVGGRQFDVLAGGGHSPEQLMLYDGSDGTFLSADQVLPRITPNISVLAMEPEHDPLGRYLKSLAELRAHVPDEVLTLPGHDWPFRDVGMRLDALASHHHVRCDRLADACRNEAKTARELIPALFSRPLDLHQISFAFAETLAHLNYMAGVGRLKWDKSGQYWRAIAS